MEYNEERLKKEVESLTDFYTKDLTHLNEVGLSIRLSVISSVFVTIVYNYFPGNALKIIENIKKDMIKYLEEKEK